MKKILFIFFLMPVLFHKVLAQDEVSSFLNDQKNDITKEVKDVLNEFTTQWKLFLDKEEASIETFVIKILSAILKKNPELIDDMKNQKMLEEAVRELTMGRLQYILPSGLEDVISTIKKKNSEKKEEGGEPSYQDLVEKNLVEKIENTLNTTVTTENTKVTTENS